MSEKTRKLMKRLRLEFPVRASALAGLTLLALMGATTFAVKARVWAGAEENVPATVETSKAVDATATHNSSDTAQTSANRQDKEQIGSELITITRFGFEPAEITRPAGKIFLMVENRSNQNPLTMRLESDRGTKIIEVVQPEDQLDWARELNAPPGHYILTVVGHPDWVCRITITD